MQWHHVNSQSGIKFRVCATYIWVQDPPTSLMYCVFLPWARFFIPIYYPQPMCKWEAVFVICTVSTFTLLTVFLICFQAVKSVVVAFMLLGLIPLLLGLLFELVVVVPLRVPLDQSPVFFPWQVSTQYFISLFRDDLKLKCWLTGSSVRLFAFQAGFFCSDCTKPPVNQQWSCNVSPYYCLLYFLFLFQEVQIHWYHSWMPSSMTGDEIFYNSS